MNSGAIRRLIELLPTVSYDLCVLTGDYRGKTYGPYQGAIDGLARVKANLQGPVYGVLGNHDTVRMVPAFEEIGIRMLLNESEAIERGGADPPRRHRRCPLLPGGQHRKGSLACARRGFFDPAVSHPGDLSAGRSCRVPGPAERAYPRRPDCLPGAIPIILDLVLPRRMGAGAWTYQDMAGYTSVGSVSCILPVRLNCPPEITLHRLLRDPRPAQ